VLVVVVEDEICVEVLTRRSKDSHNFCDHTYLIDCEGHDVAIDAHGRFQAGG